jgi:GR25 family glycosyltransferase involved in LPS biosynthesis
MSRSAAPSLSVACLLTKYYGFALESKLAATGFEDCMDELSFVKEVTSTEDVVASALAPADRAWAAQHASVWSKSAETNSPVLIFQDDVTFASSSTYSATEALVTAAEKAGYSREAHVIVVLDAASPDEASSHPSVTAANGSTLKPAQSITQLTAYVLWPAAARVLLEALPVDLPVAAFLGKHVAARSLIALVASPALTVSAAADDEANDTRPPQAAQAAPSEDVSSELVGTATHHSETCPRTQSLAHSSAPGATT